MVLHRTLRLGTSWGGAAWLPSAWSTDLKLWINASDPANLKQAVAGTTAVTAAADPVGFLTDLSGNGYHLTAAADNTTRGTFQTTDYNHVVLDGSNDAYFRALPLGAYDNVSATFGLAIRPNPATTCTLLSEDQVSSGVPFYRLCSSDGTDADDGVAQIRNDASTIFENLNNFVWGDQVFINTDVALVIIDTGSVVRWYIDGVQVGGDRSYTRSGTLTLDQFVLGARRGGGTLAGFFATRLSGLVVAFGNKSADLAAVTTYLGSLQGRSI